MSKSLLIIGAGPGISQATAERFAREGWKVILAARRAESLNTLVAALKRSGADAESEVIDVSKPAALRAALQAVSKRVGGLSAVLYNAASLRQQDLFSMKDEDIESDLAVNVAGAAHSIRAAAELFADRGGTILVTGGGLALNPNPAYASLAAGKAAVRNLVQAVAGPLAEKNIRISTLTVAAYIKPGSEAAKAVADAYWSMATGPNPGWEVRFPSA